MRPKNGQTSIQRPVEQDGIAFPGGRKTTFETMVVSSPEPGMTSRNAAKNQDTKTLDEE